MKNFIRKVVRRIRRKTEIVFVEKPPTWAHEEWKPKMYKWAHDPVEMYDQFKELVNDIVELDRMVGPRKSTWLEFNSSFFNRIIRVLKQMEDVVDNLEENRLDRLKKINTTKRSLETLQSLWSKYLNGEEDGRDI